MNDNSKRKYKQSQPDFYADNDGIVNRQLSLNQQKNTSLTKHKKPVKASSKSKQQTRNKNQDTQSISTEVFANSIHEARNKGCMKKLSKCSTFINQLLFEKKRLLLDTRNSRFCFHLLFMVAMIPTLIFHIMNMQMENQKAENADISSQNDLVNEPPVNTNYSESKQ